MLALTQVVPYLVITVLLVLVALAACIKCLLKERAESAEKMARLLSLQQQADKTTQMVNDAIKAEVARTEEINEKIIDRTYFN